jgi:hypothetical protein
VQTSVVQTSLGTAQADIDQTLPGAAQAVKGDKKELKLWPFLIAVANSA